MEGINIEFKLLDSCSDYLLYNVSNSFTEQIEVQFDNGIFNGNIVYLKESTDNYDLDVEWSELKDQKNI